MTLVGIGNVNNENLTFDFETTANTVAINSGTGVTTLTSVVGFNIGTVATPAFTFATTGAAVFNEQGAAVNFRVETDTNANGLVVDGTNNKTMVGMGTGTAQPVVSGTLDINTTNVANVGAGEDDLITYSLPANSLSAVSRGIRFIYRGICANNANSKTVNVKFGTTTLIAQLLTANADLHWWGEAIIVRNGANDQEWFATFYTDNLASGAIILTQDSGSMAQTDTSAISIRCTGTGTDNGDITETFHVVEALG